MTPTEIYEILITHLDDPLKALNAFICALDDRVKSTYVTYYKEHKRTEEIRVMSKMG